MQTGGMLSDEKGGEVVRLYSPAQITAATVIGAPIAGAVLLARNYARLGDAVSGRKALLWGGCVTAGLLVVSLFLPDRFPNSVLPIGYSAAMYQLAKHLMGERLVSHITAGGARGSTWVAVGVGMASLLVIVVLMVGIAWVAP
jgi:hypothetical protein